VSQPNVKEFLGASTLFDEFIELLHLPLDMRKLDELVRVDVLPAIVRRSVYVGGLFSWGIPSLPRSLFSGHRSSPLHQRPGPIASLQTDYTVVACNATVLLRNLRKVDKS
jgi:hypothetical protein